MSYDGTIKEQAMQAIRDADGWISTPEIARRIDASSVSVNSNLRYERRTGNVEVRSPDGPGEPYEYRLEADDD